MTATLFLALVAIGAGLYLGVRVVLGCDASRFDGDGQS